MGDANRELTPAAEALVQILWPGAKPGGDGTYRVGGLDQVEGRSAVVFLDGPKGPRFYDNNGSVNMDLLDVLVHRGYGRNIGAVLKALRTDGTLAAVRPRATMGAATATPSAPGAQPAPAVSQKRQKPQATWDSFALGSPDSVLNLQDLDELPLWVPTADKKCVGLWRYSTRGEGGVKLARLGGPYVDRNGVHMVLQPWMTRAEILRLIEQGRYLSWRKAVPTLCLSGSPDYLHPRDELVLDVDVEEGSRPAELRDRFMAPLIEMGLHVFASDSGRGRHIIARVHPYDAGLRHWRSLPPDPKAPNQGFRVEVFPAGTRQQVVWRRAQQLSGPGVDDPLPRLEFSVVNTAVRRAYGF